MRAFPWAFSDSSSRFKTLWSAVASFPSVVGNEIQSVRPRRLFLLGACGLCHAAYFTIRICWDMCVHIVISFCFGIVSSLCPNYVGLCVFVRVSLPHRLQPKECCFRKRVPPAFCFSADGDFLISAASSSIIRGIFCYVTETRGTMLSVQLVVVFLNFVNWGFWFLAANGSKDPSIFPHHICSHTLSCHRQSCRARCASSRNTPPLSHTTDPVGHLKQSLSLFFLFLFEQFSSSNSSVCDAMLLVSER